jgi:hypothetical protein
LVALFDGLAFVIVLFALTKRDDQLDVVALGQESQWHDAHTRLLTVGQFIDLSAAGKQLPRGSVDAGPAIGF